MFGPNYNPWLPIHYFGGVASDAEVLYHALGRRPIAVNQPPFGGTDYPFVTPSADIAYRLGDLWLSYQDDAHTLTPPFRVAWCYGFGEEAGSAIPGYPSPVHDHDILIVDAHDQTVFDSTQASHYVDVPWSDRLLTIQWQTATAVLRLTKHTHFPLGEIALTGPLHLAPQSAVLDVRTYQRMPVRVTTLRVSGQSVSGNIVLEEGFNLGMTAATASNPGGRRRTVLTLQAAPGSGLGRVPSCEDEEPVLRQLGQATADATGTLRLDMTDCYRLERPLEVVSESPLVMRPAYAGLTAQQAAATLVFGNDCAPRYDCDDFVATQKAVLRLWDQLKTLGTTAETARDQYATNKSRWEAQAACRRSRAARLVVNQEYQCKLAIGGMYCNPVKKCLRDVRLRLTFQGFEDGEIAELLPVFRCRETFRRGSDTGYKDTPHVFGASFPVLDTDFAFLDASGTAAVRSRFRSPECRNGQSYRIILTVHVPDQYDEEGKLIALPAPATVPPEVLALWGVGSDPTVRALVESSAPLIPGRGCFTG